MENVFMDAFKNNEDNTNDANDPRMVPRLVKRAVDDDFERVMPSQLTSPSLQLAKEGRVVSPVIEL